MDNIFELFLDYSFYKEGIVPMAVDTLHFDFLKILVKTSSEESLKMKRKFRKLWRKEVKQKISVTKTHHVLDIMNLYGLGGDNPSITQKYRRKKLVMVSMRNKTNDFIRINNIIEK